MRRGVRAAAGVTGGAAGPVRPLRVPAGGHRAALKHVQGAVGERALDIHGPAHAALQLNGQARDRRRAFVGQGGFPPQEPRYVDLRRPGGNGDRHAPLLGDLASGDPEIGLAHHVHVRRDRAADHALAQPPRGVDPDRGAVAADRVQGEGDGGGVGRDQALHQHRQAGRTAQPVPPAVGQRPLGTPRGPAPRHGMKNGVDPRHVQIRLVLAGEGGVGAVLVDRGRTDRHRGIGGSAAGGQVGVCLGYGADHHGGRQRAGGEGVGRGGHAETGRHREVGGETRERGRLSAHEGRARGVGGSERENQGPGAVSGWNGPRPPRCGAEGGAPRPHTL